MTDRERKVKQLRRLIAVAHAENYDFVYMPVGDAKTIVRLLEEQERGEHYEKDHSGIRYPSGSDKDVPGCPRAEETKCPYGGLCDWSAQGAAAAGSRCVRR